MNYKENENKLREACCIGDLEQVDKLLTTSQLNINSKNPINGWTALHWACKRNHYEIVRMLLLNGCDPNIENEKGQKPIDLVMLDKDKAILKLFTEFNTNQCNNNNIHADQNRTDKVEVEDEENDLKEPTATRRNITMNNDSEFMSNFAKEFLPNSTTAPSTNVAQFVPNYLKNPPLINNTKLNAKRLSHAHFAQMPKTNFPASNYQNETILRIRIANILDRDFIEIGFDSSKLATTITYTDFLSRCCDELNVDTKCVERIRKLPDTRLRNDADVHRLQHMQSLELVLTSATTSLINNLTNGANSSSYPTKDQTILY